jgi:hypothetical protein
MDFPSENVSVIAGMRPLGLISKNQSSFWVFLDISMPVTSYGRLVIVTRQETKSIFIIQTTNVPELLKLRESLSAHLFTRLIPAIIGL